MPRPSDSHGKCRECSRTIKRYFVLCERCFIAAGLPRTHKHSFDEAEEPEPPLVAQNNAFRNAMLKAIKRRLENPPGIGVSTKPCTANPMRVDIPREVRMRSPMAALSELGDG